MVWHAAACCAVPVCAAVTRPPGQRTGSPPPGLLHPPACATRDSAGTSRSPARGQRWGGGREGCLETSLVERWTKCSAAAGSCCRWRNRGSPGDAWSHPRSPATAVLQQQSCNSSPATTAVAGTPGATTHHAFLPRHRINQPLAAVAADVAGEQHQQRAPRQLQVNLDAAVAVAALAAAGVASCCAVVAAAAAAGAAAAARAVRRHWLVIA